MMKKKQNNLDAALIKKHVERTRKKNLENDFNMMQSRARSITVGTAFGGTVEVGMRKADGSSLFVILQPVETIELIHQLAAIIGCHIHIQPRKDFASWRKWNHTEEELLSYSGIQPLPGVGHPPHSNDISKFAELGATLPPPEQQPGLNIERKQDEHVAIKKTID